MGCPDEPHTENWSRAVQKPIESTDSLQPAVSKLESFESNEDGLLEEYSKLARMLLDLRTLRAEKKDGESRMVYDKVAITVSSLCDMLDASHIYDSD
jgi:hypothetical protein